MDTSKIQSYYSQSRSEMLKYVPESAKCVIDFGCGEGRFGALLRKRRGCTVLGVEVNDAARAVALRNLDDVLKDIHDFLPSGDCVVFNDVLEHQEFPEGLLDLAKDMLVCSEQKTVVASIPNVRCIKNLFRLLIKREWEYADSGICDKTHLRFFTKKSIESLFNNCGYKIIKLEGINPVVPIWLGFWLFDMLYLQFAVVAELYER